MKTINQMTITEFKKIPYREWNEDIGEFDSLIILPTKRKHNSGYRCMDFIAVKNNKPLKRLSGCSDVIHFDGISGRGKYKNEFLSNVKDSKGWSIDSLPKSGLLRIFSRDKLTCGSDLSSFEIYSK